MNARSRTLLPVRAASRLLLPIAGLMTLVALVVLGASPAVAGGRTTPAAGNGPASRIAGGQAAGGQAVSTAANDQRTAISAAAAAVASYLQARAEQVLPGAQTAALARYMAPGSAAWPVERLVAAGARLNWKSWGIKPLSVDCSVSPGALQLSASGAQATVKVTAAVAIHWRDADGMSRTSEDTTDHDLILVLTRSGWLVDRDEYLSVLTPGELVAADAAPTLVQQAAQKLEEAQQAESLRQFLQPIPLASESVTATAAPALTSAPKLASAPVLTAAPAGTITPSYIATITYNRSGAAKYADAHTSSVSGSTNYNPNYHNFTPDGGDCANFTSQCMFLGGGYPMLGSRSSGFNAGWWYDNNAGFPYCSASWRGANTRLSRLPCSPVPYAGVLRGRRPFKLMTSPDFVSVWCPMAENASPSRSLAARRSSLETCP